MSAGSPIASGPGVRWAGAQRDVLGGDLRGHVDLETLSSVPHLYGLGPLEGLRGEVSIFGSVPSIARIEQETVVTAASWSARACFLVWAQVPDWSESVTDSFPLGLDGVEREVVALARDAGLDPDRPLPFRVRATAVEATLHVLDKRDGLPHNPERHEQAKARRTLEYAVVELVGFHSRRHRGIFTPRESNVHVHLHALLSPGAERGAARRPPVWARAPAPLTSAAPIVARGRRHEAAGFLLAGALLVALVLVALSVGRYPASPGQLSALLWAKLTDAPTTLPVAMETVVFRVRGPRVLSAIAIGATLAAAGSAYQGLFRNPLVSPDILGVSSGAALGATIGIYLSWGVAGIQGLNGGGKTTLFKTILRLLARGGAA